MSAKKVLINPASIPARLGDGTLYETGMLVQLAGTTFAGVVAWTRFEQTEPHWHAVVTWAQQTADRPRALQPMHALIRGVGGRSLG